MKWNSQSYLIRTCVLYYNNNNNNNNKIISNFYIYNNAWSKIHYKTSKLLPLVEYINQKGKLKSVQKDYKRGLNKNFEFYWGGRVEEMDLSYTSIQYNKVCIIVNF